MGLTSTLLLLLLAALIEAGGDALIRSGLHASALLTKGLLLLSGALILLGYGCLVNAPPWQFGRLIGVYVVFFFLMAQAIAWLGFHEKPSIPLVVGGGLIVAGGLVISLSR
jgi:drug/metabolite transporter (DMT)-like permease